MSEIRIIKKYPNRRLYDTAISSYITLEDVRRLVIENVSIQVVDARTKNDITHSTLLQIILEQEESGPPIFTSEILQQMIRAYRGAMQSVISRTLEHAMDFFSEKQAELKQGMTPALQASVEKDPLTLMSDSAKQRQETWQSIQTQWVMALTNPHSHTESRQAEQALEFEGQKQG